MKFTAQEILDYIGGAHLNPKAGVSLSSFDIENLSTLSFARAHECAFFFSLNYLNDFLATKAGLIITGDNFAKKITESTPKPPAWESSIIFSVADPYFIFGKMTQKFSPFSSNVDHQEAPEKFTHPSASIDPTAIIGAKVSIGPNVVVGPRSVIEDQVVLYPGTFVGPDCRVGQGSVIFPNVTLLEKVRIGKRCRIHSGCVIGADGFGYAPVMKGKIPIGHQKIYHLGGVIIGDEVEIGANTTVDRGTLGDTKIGNFVKIDNLVQVGHNCDIGDGAIICGCAGMSGSSTLGKFVIIGAQSGTGNQVVVGDYAKLAAYTGAAKDIPAGAEVAGIPARPLKEHYRMLARMLRKK